jgi:hypothetical protein
MRALAQGLPPGNKKTGRLAPPGWAFILHHVRFAPAVGRAVLYRMQRRIRTSLVQALACPLG